jgi:replicative DNA helicase
MFGCRVTRNDGVGDRHQLLISGAGNRWSPIGVGKWLRDLGIFGQRSHQKELPAEVFSLPNDQIALLLRHLWATDGTISVRKPGQPGTHKVGFTTCSRRLADDVGALLLRMGVVSRTHTVMVGHYRPVYLVQVSGAESQRAFLQEVGAFGPRCEAAALLTEALRTVESNPRADALPEETLQRAGAAMSARGITRARTPASKDTALSQCEEPQTSPMNDLFWDRVLSIAADGEEEVYDLTVPGPASWLADGVVSHNSGSLEQDSDIILLIYREEVYDRNTTKKGIAEIDLVKHRNGETGTFLLTFQGQYTRFANYVSDSYAEGILR